MQFKHPCDACNGTGQIITINQTLRNCLTCQGTGEGNVIDDETVIRLSSMALHILQNTDNRLLAVREIRRVYKEYFKSEIPIFTAKMIMEVSFLSLESIKRRELERVRNSKY